jgi:uncharacterized protein DUF4062
MRPNREIKRPSAQSMTNPTAMPEAAHPSLQPGESALLVFVSSVMRPDLRWARDETVRTLDSAPFLSRWAFEYTPASSEPVDEAYLRRVRESDLVVWLIGKEITDPVENEIREALTSDRRLLAVMLPVTERDAATEAMVSEVGLRAKWVSVGSEGELRRTLELSIGDEIIRAMRRKPELGRMLLLEEIGRASRARCIERWLALGASWNEATALADDPAVGAPSPEFQKRLINPVVLIVGELGAGKSLMGERLLQEALTRARDCSDAPVPVYLPAEKALGRLQEFAQETTRALGNPRLQGGMIVLDGVEQTGMEAAVKLLAEARILANSWPNTRVIITTRPLPVFAHAAEIVQMPLLAQAEAESLIGRFASTVPISVFVSTMSPSLRDAIRRPLFAILLGLFLRKRSWQTPHSTGQLLSSLVESALSGAQADEASANSLLQRLAAISLERGGSTVPSAEVAPNTQIQRLLESGLIIERSGTLGFPLPILTEWFAAQSLAAGIRSPKDISTDQRQLERWQNSLAIVVGTLDDAHVAAIIAPIIENHPAFAATVVKEGLARWGLDETVLPPPALECGQRVRTAMSAWAKAIGPLAQLIAPVREDGSLLPTGVETGGAWLTVSWNQGWGDLPDVSELPADAPTRATNGWFATHTARPGRQAAWAWRWALEELTSSLSKLLQTNSLPAPPSPLTREANWQTAVALMGQSPHYYQPIALDEIEALIPSGLPDFYIGHRRYDADLLRQEVRERQANGDTELHPPWPGPDGNIRYGGRREAYSDQQILVRAKAIYAGAIEGYCQIVKLWFSRLAERMGTFVTLPARLVGVIDPRRRDDGFLQMPVIGFYMEALPYGSVTRVDFSLGEQEAETNQLAAAWENLISRRPDAAPWISSTLSVGMLDIFDPQPATKLTYEWLKSDLKRIAWA